jgi:hypothetical protein
MDWTMPVGARLRLFLFAKRPPISLFAFEGELFQFELNAPLFVLPELKLT